MDKRRLEKLISELQASNVQQRRAASYKLSKYKDPIAVSALIQAYNDTDGSVQQNVITGLRNIGSKEAVDFLNSKEIPLSLPKNAITSSRSIGWFILGFVGWSIVSLASNLFFLSLFDNPYKTEGAVITIMTVLQMLGYGLAYLMFHKSKHPIGIGIIGASVPYLMGFILRSGCIPPGLPFPLSLISGC